LRHHGEALLALVLMVLRPRLLPAPRHSVGHRAVVVVILGAAAKARKLEAHSFGDKWME